MRLRAILVLAALPWAHAADAVKSVLILPPVVSPGEAIEAHVVDLARTPAGGTWNIAGVEATGESPLRIRLPESLRPGAPVPVSFTSASGAVVFQAAAAEGVWVAPAPALLDPGPRITGCKPRAVVGDAACVCGFFPGESRAGLRLDGKPVKPVAASLRTLYISFRDVEPGKHVVSGDPAAGFPAADRQEITVVRIDAAIDTNALWRGQGTQIHIEVKGTAERLRLRLANRTPEIVSLDPAAFQLASTSGGARNRLDRRVRGLRRGDFHIDYELDDAACPCGGDEEQAEQEPEASGSGPRRLVLPREVVAAIAAAAPAQVNAVAAQLAAANALAVTTVYNLASSGDALIVFLILDGAAPALKAAALAADPRVRLAQPNFLYTTSAQAGGSYEQLQYGPRLMRADQVQPVASGKGVTLGLIDTGVDARHARLAGRVTDGGDFTGKGAGADIHGTMLAGVIASVAAGAAMVSFKACQPHSPQDVEARCWSVSMARALDAAILRGVRVANLSIGGPEEKLVARLVETAVRRGTAVVAAAGNGGPDARPSYPAAQAEAIAVTAVDERRQLYAGATRGAYIDLAAPGVDILSTAPGNRSLISSGTSFAAAYISGVAALLLERTPGARPEALQTMLERTAADLGPAGKDAMFGSGLADACRAAALACR